jgi:ribonuclease HI
MIATFGKYKSTSYSSIFQKDITYFKWLYKQPWFKQRYINEYNACKLLLELPIHKHEIFVVYTDGACPNNGTKKAYMGVGIHFSIKNVIKINDVSEIISHSIITNNVAELFAIKKAIELCINKKINDAKRVDIIIYTDSKYSIDAVTKWYQFWEKNNVIHTKKNIDLIEEIYKYYKKYNITFQHVRAHTLNMDEHSIGNRTADKLARQKFKI